MNEVVRARLYDRVYVCRVCKSKLRAAIERVKEGKIKCRRCGSKALRPKSREAKQTK